MQHFTFFFYIFLLLFSFTGLAQHEKGNLLLQNYKAKKDYDGHTQNWTTLQSATGLLYIGNNDGLIEYDGVNFRQVKSPGVLRCLATDSLGVLYAGFKGNFGYFKPDSVGKLSYISLSEKLPEKENNFANTWRVIVYQGSVYFCTFEGIFQYKNLQLSKIFRPKTAFFLCFLIDNKFYTSETKKGLLCLEKDSLQLVKNTEIFAEDRVFYLGKYQNKQLMASTRKTGTYLIDLQAQTTTKFPMEIDSLMLKNKFASIYPSTDNRLIIATTNGEKGAIIADKSGKWQQNIERITGLQDNIVYDVQPDKQQGLWLALNNGLTRAAINYPITYWNELNGLGGNKAYAIYRHQGIVYIGSAQGVFYIENNQLKKVENSAEQVWNILPHTTTDGKTNLLYINNNGIWQIENFKAKKVYPLTGAYDLIKLPHQNNVFYCLSRAGMEIISYAGGKFVSLGKVKGIEGEVRNHTIDANNNVWIVLEKKAICVLKNISTTDYQANEIIKFDKEKLFDMKEDIYMTSLDKKVIFVNKGNVINYQDGKFVQDTTFTKKLHKDNITTIGLSRIFKDSHQQIWLAGSKDSNKKRKSLLGYLSNAGNATWKDKIFSYLPSMEFNHIYEDSLGLMWFATSEGVFRYDTQKEFEPSTNFNALIRQVNANDSTIFYGHYASFGTDNFAIANTQTNFFIKKLAYLHNSLTFHFAAPFFDNPQETEYSYMLEGFDEHWSEWTKETKKEYTNLFEKNYTFRVKARNVYGEVSKEASYQFSILPPWYRTWWAYIAYLLGSVLLVWTIVRMNTARLKKQNLKLEKIVQERTTEVVHKNQELEQQKEEILAQHDAISEKNQRLGIAFQEINQQKEEIEAQRDNLELANQEINQQKEEIETQRDNISAQKQAVEKAYDNIQTLSEIGRKITAILDIKTIISTVYTNVNQLMAAEAFGIGVYYAKTKEIIFEGFVEKGEILPKHTHKITENSLPILCFKEQKEIVINHLATEYQNYFAAPIQIIEGEMPQSLIYLPLTLDNKRIGVITVQSFKANSYTNFHHTMLQSLASYIAIALDNANAYTVIDAKNHQITGSIRYAQTIQQAILPTKQQVATYFPENFVLYQPKDVVSGDFYWLSVSKNKETQITENIFFGTMDCTGHGVPGAFMSMIGNTLLNKIVANNPTILPAQLLEELHQEIQIALHQKDDEANKDGMDTCLVKFIYNAKTSLPEVFFAGAKRPLYVIKANGELVEYKGSRKSIGGQQKEGAYFENKTVGIAKNDTLILATDGYIDQNDNHRSSMGSNVFKQILLEIAKQTPEQQKQTLIEKLKKHQQDEEQRDDITVVGLKIT